ncbi:MAG TPA: hypothetical protein VHL53_14240 [Acidimicrobiia bacterium]|nr:hypothetical protein [Acidimicrobiia bacterium]
MELKAGTRLRSQACTTEVIVVRPPAGDVDLRCGGAPLVPVGGDVNPQPLDPGHQAGTQLGKRYADGTTGLELLCTKAGEGSLSVNGAPINMKDAKPLPSSD